MASIVKNVTDEVREANRLNSAVSTGPVTEAGKKQSSMNALKPGRYAKRLDPVSVCSKTSARKRRRSARP